MVVSFSTALPAISSRRMPPDALSFVRGVLCNIEARSANLISIAQVTLACVT